MCRLIYSKIYVLNLNGTLLPIQFEKKCFQKIQAIGTEAAIIVQTQYAQHFALAEQGEALKKIVNSIDNNTKRKIHEYFSIGLKVIYPSFHGKWFSKYLHCKLKIYENWEKSHVYYYTSNNVKLFLSIFDIGKYCTDLLRTYFNYKQNEFENNDKWYDIFPEPKAQYWKNEFRSFI